MRVETKYSGSEEEVITDSKEGREVNRKKKEFTVYSVCTHDKGWVLHRLKTETQIYKETETSRWKREKTRG